MECQLRCSSLSTSHKVTFPYAVPQCWAGLEAWPRGQQVKLVPRSCQPSGRRQLCLQQLSLFPGRRLPEKKIPSTGPPAKMAGLECPPGGQGQDAAQGRPASTYTQMHLAVASFRLLRQCVLSYWGNRGRLILHPYKMRQGAQGQSKASGRAEWKVPFPLPPEMGCWTPQNSGARRGQVIFIRHMWEPAGWNQMLTTGKGFNQFSYSLNSVFSVYFSEGVTTHIFFNKQN